METDACSGRFSWLAWLMSPTSNDAQQPIRNGIQESVPSRGRVLMSLRWWGPAVLRTVVLVVLVSGELSNLEGSCSVCGPGVDDGWRMDGA